jgi:hypothetical protein
MGDFPTIEITDDQRIWLEAVFNARKKGEKLTERILYTRLNGKISNDFDPGSIDSKLLRGLEISLLGIIHIDSDSDLVDHCDKVIMAIRNGLLADPNRESFTADDIASELGLLTDIVGYVFILIGHFGRFWSSASFVSGKHILSSITIGDAFNEYLRFDGIEKLMNRFYIANEQKKSGLENQLFLMQQSANTDESIDNFEVEINPIFKTRITEIDRKLCFVLMPFTEDWSSRVYRDLIRANVEMLGLQCLRADDLNGQIIIEDIWIKINQCAFVIADVTNRNANVMYELGIVHTIGKPAILLTQDVGNIPFDFTHLRHYKYSDNVDGFKEMESKLPKIIKDIYIEHYSVDLNDIVSVTSVT